MSSYALAAAGVAPLADDDPQRFVSLVIGQALMVGALQLMLGLARSRFTSWRDRPNRLYGR